MHLTVVRLYYKHGLEKNAFYSQKNSEHVHGQFEYAKDQIEQNKMFGKD
jgi:hypothetical protein